MRLLLVAMVGLAFGADNVDLQMQNPARRNILTNQGIVMLAEAGYSDSFIVDMIYHKRTQFDVSAEGLAWLSRNGMSETVVRAMIANEKKDARTAVIPSYSVGPTAGLQEQAGPVLTGRQTVSSVRSAIRYYEAGLPQAPSSVGASQVAVPFALPSPVPMQTSTWWYPQTVYSDRWYSVPRVPAYHYSWP